MRVNLTEPFLLARAALAHLLNVSGNIGNVGSIDGLGANTRHSAYCASQAGLHVLIPAIAVDDGGRCSAIAPGWIETPFNSEFVASLPSGDGYPLRFGAVQPLGRTATPDEVATLAAWLASEEAGFVTGQIYTHYGGEWQN